MINNVFCPDCFTRDKKRILIIAMFSNSSMLVTHVAQVIVRSLLLINFVFFPGAAFADRADNLKEKYDEIEGQLLDNIYGIPIYLESNSGSHLMQGEVYGILYHPFKKVSRSLSTIENWCEIMPQHFNIKACTYEYKNNICRLTFYSGRKYYKKADDVYHLNYDFNVKMNNDERLYVSLNSEWGPLDTKNYNISVEAIPLTDQSTFFHLSYEYQFGFVTRIAMSTYLSTIGHKKIGFSITGRDENNKPVYVGGVRGIIERNAVRYYFAIKSYLNTQGVDINKRFETRLSDWYELTERYHEQLHELDKSDYLKYKKMERKNQLRLQKEIDANIKGNQKAIKCLI